MLEWVQCEDCSKWFTLPEGVTSDALPDVFVCSLRWWDCSLQEIKTGYKDDWCRKGAIKTTLVTQWIRLLETRAAEAQDAHLSPDTTTALQLDHNLTDPFVAGSSSEEAQQVDPDPDQTEEAQDPLVNHTPRQEGAARSRNKGLSDVCKYTLYLAQWYAAHVGRGK